LTAKKNFLILAPHLCVLSVFKALPLLAVQEKFINYFLIKKVSE